LANRAQHRFDGAIFSDRNDDLFANVGFVVPGEALELAISACRRGSCASELEANRPSRWPAFSALAQPQRPSVSLDLHDEAANWDP